LADTEGKKLLKLLSQKYQYEPAHFFKKATHHPTYTMGGLYLSTPTSAGGYDATGPHRHARDTRLFFAYEKGKFTG
jgi:hypothetical protein